MTVTVPGEPLLGYTVAVTADRRREELASLLARRGARVVTGSAIRIVPLPDDDLLRSATEACLEGPLDDVVVTTAIGLRGWLEAADGWGLGDALRHRLGAARVIARGPKAKGAVRAAGLSEAWSPASESSREVLRWLLDQGVAGRRVVVQLHGEPVPDLLEGLRAAGAVVVAVPVYRWTEPEDLLPLQRLVEGVVGGGVDAITFTSAPAVLSTLALADRLGAADAVLARLRSGQTLACCVGPVTAEPLRRLGVEVVAPDRSRLGALVREVCLRLPERDGGPLVVGARTLVLRGHGVLLDGAFVAVPPAQMTVLRALAAMPGRVLARDELVASLPTATDGHAVDMAVARLRSALGDATLVQTVVKRGYRLAC